MGKPAGTDIDTGNYKQDMDYSSYNYMDDSSYILALCIDIDADMYNHDTAVH